MARVTIMGRAAVITSSVKLEDLKAIEKYRPEALTLYGGKDGNEPIFKIVIQDGCSGDINKYGAVFGNTTNTGDGLAAITLGLYAPEEGEDIKEVFADKFGKALTNLNAIEGILPSVLEEVRDERAEVIGNITVAQ